MINNNTIPEQLRIKGYKVFDENLKCMNFQYEIDKTFKHDADLILCKSGFHFCEKLIDCFNYYQWNPKNKVCVIVANTEKTISNDGDKKVTSEIYISHEISWEEVMKMCNTGNSNTGNRNTGDSNTGHWNTGNWNTGDSNTGNRNTGNSNTGNWNTGDRNTGDSNTGNSNTGNSNTGNWNTGDSNTGFLCAETPSVKIFDTDTFLTYEQVYKTDWYNLLSKVSFLKTIRYSDMSEEEKSQNPNAKVTGVYLKNIEPKQAWQDFWNNLTILDKEIIKSIPNFTNEKWQRLTGIKI